MSKLSEGDLIVGNGHRVQGREVLRIDHLDDHYAYCTIPGHIKERTGDNMIRIGRAHIHTDGFERRIGWDRKVRAGTGNMDRVIAKPSLARDRVLELAAARRAEQCV